jgi:hypothetical protein
MAPSMKMAVFWDVAPFYPVDFDGVSEVLTASDVRWKIFPKIFRNIFRFTFFREIFITVMLMTQHSCRLQIVRGCYTY